MSLTSFINIPRIREMFSTNIPKPKIKIESDILAPPLTKNYSIVGIAFDYLLRMFLKRINTNAIEGPWIAEILLTVPFSPILNDAVIKSAEGEPGRVIEYKETELTKYLKQILLKCKDQYSKFLQSGKITDKLLEDFLLLSQFDPFFRTGRVFDIKHNVDKKDIKDLRNLISLLHSKQSLFISKEHCLLNPTFGEASKMIGGADADVVIDDIIIDIKTTIKAAFTRYQFNQILGYYLLNSIGGIDGINKKVKINRIGIYYSRFGEMLLVPIKNIIEEDKMNNFLEWFKKEIE